MFDALPGDNAMAILVVMHLDPTRESGIAPILGQHSKMTVTEVVDGMLIEANHVYVIPPAASLVLDGQRLRLAEPAVHRGARYPIDRLFQSLASGLGERAICIVLSGSGTDGTEGLKAVKAAGGCVLVQEPETARFGSMPRSAIAANLADHILAPEEMPAVLRRYTRHAYAFGPAIDEDGPSELGLIDPVLTLLRKHAGHDFRLYKRSTLTRRIHRRMGLHDLNTIEDYVAFLRAQPVEIKTLARDLMINVTSFFRDPEAWATLDATVLTPLVAGRASGSTVRFWVPACATGEEAYTLAMMLVDRAEAAGKQFDIKIFATDGRDDNLHIARAGAYSESAVSTIPHHLLDRHFSRNEGTYRVTEDLRSMVVFASHNLLRDPPFSKVDLVSCRNLLIYFDTVAQKRAIALMHFALCEGGYLLLGSAESVSGLDHLFETVSKTWRIFRRLGLTRHDIMHFPLLPGSPRQARTEEPRLTTNARPIQRVVDVAQRALLDRFAPASVLIERDGQVIWVHGSTGDFLEPPQGAPTLNILAMARHGLRAKLRSALQQAAQEQRSVDFHVRVRHNHKDQPVAVSVTPVAMPSDTLLLVSFRAVSEIAAPPESEGNLITQHAFEDQLLSVRAELQETIQQLEALNEELKLANEEVTSMNEELQSTNEELETSKEELQSFNEELQTVNSQLHHKNQELAETTDTLNNLLAGSEIATVFLDRDFCIRWFSPSSKELLNLVESDIGRPVTDFAWKVDDPDLLRDAEAVLENLSGIDAEVRSNGGDWYLRRALPYRTQDDRIAGVVITFVNITDTKLAKDAINEARIYAEAIIDTVRNPVLVLDGDLRVNSVNPAFCEAFNCPADECRNYLLHELDHGAWDIPELRRLLRKVLSQSKSFDGYEIDHVFPRRGRRHMLLNARKLVQGGGHAELILLAIEDVTERHETEALRHTLINELSHRVKNTLAIVQSISSQTLRQSETLTEFKLAFEGRLYALARVHDLLVSENWTGARLGELVRRTMEPHGLKDRIHIAGPSFNVTPEAGVAMAMVLNELATNAVKYGALSGENGHLEVSWHVAAKADGPWVVLEWTESGGPPVTAPARRGFGSTLIERSIGHQLGGNAALSFRAGGLHCDLSFPLRRAIVTPTPKET